MNEVYIFILIQQFLSYLQSMSKGFGCPDKNLITNTCKKTIQPIKFNLNEKQLACFKSSIDAQTLTVELAALRDAKTLVFPKPIDQKPILTLNSVTQPLRQRPRIASFRNNFHEQVVIMHYDDIDVYIDKSTKKKTNSKQSQSSSSQKKGEDIESQDQFVSSCVRVITQQTDNTSSQGYSQRNEALYRHFTPQKQCFYMPAPNYYYPRGKVANRNRHSVTTQESRVLSICEQKIEFDGRTTIMVKNIPNKYTQDMLLEEFSLRCPGSIEKFDFFYLPIDKNNESNLGYAFVNFIKVEYIKEFYREFHLRKWTKNKSPKTCELTYAVCQGTLQLANHFKHTKTLQQKDKRLRPLIGTNLVSRIREIVESQRTKQ